MISIIKLYATIESRGSYVKSRCESKRDRYEINPLEMRGLVRSRIKTILALPRIIERAYFDFIIIEP